MKNYSNLNNQITYKFLKSIFAVNGVLMDTDDIINWLAEQNKRVHVKISKTAFNNLNQWEYRDGSLMHQSGKFFSIDGIRIVTNWGNLKSWEQPIINQPEIGYLGFITKEFNGILHFLVQAKIEPGNVNYVQLSPSLQATRSNYTQVHEGKKPLYLEYFQKASPDQILLDQLQSEQGARFLKKRNRNIIIKVEEDLPVYDNFIWVTLGQLKTLMQRDNLVNMDSRTVISCIQYGVFENEVVDFFNFLGYNTYEKRIQKALLKSAITDEGSVNNIEDIITFLTHLKSIYDLNIMSIPLNKVENWIFSEKEIYHKDNKFFKVIAVDVEIGNREVVKWGQPMIEPAQEGICAFICKEINGILHFIVQAKMECGNHDVVEFAPTVQCLTGNFKYTKEGALPFLGYVLKAKPEQIIFDTLQSEEGGRFFKEQNRNLIVVAGDEFPEDLPDKYIWMTLNQMLSFIKYNNYINIQARSLIAAISFI